MTRPPRISNLKDPAPAAAAGRDPVTSESTRVSTWYAEAIAWLAGTEGLVGRADDWRRPPGLAS